MHCSWSASLISTTRTSCTIASSILRSDFELRRPVGLFRAGLFHLAAQYLDLRHAAHAVDQCQQLRHQRSTRNSSRSARVPTVAPSSRVAAIASPSTRRPPRSRRQRARARSSGAPSACRALRSSPAPRRRRARPGRAPAATGATSAASSQPEDCTSRVISVTLTIPFIRGAVNDRASNAAPCLASFCTSIPAAVMRTEHRTREIGAHHAHCRAGGTRRPPQDADGRSDCDSPRQKWRSAAKPRRTKSGVEEVRLP